MTPVTTGDRHPFRRLIDDPSSAAMINIWRALRDCGCPWGPAVAVAVAERATSDPDPGRTQQALVRLAWLRANGCPWDRSVCEVAAASKDDELKQWLIDHGCPCGGELHPVLSRAQPGPSHPEQL